MKKFKESTLKKVDCTVVRTVGDLIKVLDKLPKDLTVQSHWHADEPASIVTIYNIGSHDTFMSLEEYDPDVVGLKEVDDL